MKAFSFLLALIGACLLMAAAPGAANAQATRTWVSGVGDDANTCGRTDPCKTFAGAISKTSAGGEINVLDPGGFGGVTITKAITIRADHVEAGVLVAGTPVVTVNISGGGGQVVLEGLDFEGLGTGTFGLKILSATSVILRNSQIHGFATNAVDFSLAPAGAKVLIQDSVISLNGGGVNVTGNGGAAVTAVIDNSTIETNTNYAVQVAQGGAAFLSKTNLIGTGPKLVITGNGTVTSYGNNVIRGTSAAVTTTLPRQ